MKIAPRAQLSQEFVDTLREIYTARLEDYKRAIKEYPYSQQVNAYFSKNKMHIAKLISLLKDKSAFDFELTRLRSLNYSEYCIKTNSKGSRYLCGLSFPVVIPIERVKLNLGPYWVCTLVDFLKGCDRDGMQGQNGYRFHFYPERQEMSETRTPHHYGYWQNSETPSSPLDYGSSTCLGGFNTIIYSLAACGDVTEYLRNCFIYINRHSPGDQLRYSTIRSFPWAEVV
ncbi:MAG: hypothetical protein AAGU17_00585 [Anaerolineaceae bacterium]